MPRPTGWLLAKHSADPFAERVRRVFAHIERLPRPVIAAINGFALFITNYGFRCRNHFYSFVDSSINSESESCL